MVPSANLLGFAGGELAKKLPKVLGVLLETTLSSVVELVLFVVLIHNDRNGDLIPVIQAAILGSVLANLLLCLGLCFFFGGIRREEQSFHEAVSEVGSGLLLVAGFGLLIPSAFYSALSSSSKHAQLTPERLDQSTLIISRATAVILLVAFMMYLFYNLHSHHSIFDEVLEYDEHQDEDREKELKRAKLTLVECFIAIATSLACVCMSAVFLVEEIEHIVERGVSDNFVGLILVPLVEKAAEHLTAIDEAWDNQINFALFHCLGPSIQTALLNAPLAVIVGWGLGKDLGLNFEIFMIVLVVLAILVVGNFLRDGKSNYLEGGLCVLVYVIIAVSTWYYPQIESQTDSMEPAHIIFDTFKERNITVDRKKVLSAFENAESASAYADWVTEHVTNDLLLSQEELTLYSALEISGALDELISSRSTRATRPFLEGELEQAIISLNASTVAIRRQTAMNSSQYQLMNSQLHRKEERESRVDIVTERFRSLIVSERQTAAAVSNEISRELEVDIKHEQERVAAEGRKSLSSLTTRLKYDDKELVHLKRVAYGVKHLEHHASVARRAIDLGMNHAQYVAGEVQHRLDRLYLNNIQIDYATMSTETTRTESEILSALEEELESLHPEINILAEMSTKQQLIEPILREIQIHHGALRAAFAQRLHHLGDIVSLMASATRDFTKGLQEQDSIYNTEVANLMPASSATTMQRDSGTQAKQAASSQISKNFTALLEFQAVAELARKVGITLEHLSFEGTFEPLEYLEKKRHDQLESSQGHGLIADAPLNTALFPTDWAIQSLLPRLQTESESEASLSNIGHRIRLTELESDLHCFQDRVRRLKPDLLHRNDPCSDNFMRKWDGRTFDI
ncbi:hydrogen/calcium exchanger domain-containing protein [Aspergillus saccharolyticus JOP 1030-1]|uniref:Vacuolar H+/Ca2+ exchanger n=1 Tax=Aspergillus saccharolyticus JOP 1030-1 TaxID=1450539 RepID=A0A319A333_9EURO|nr:vacuolar H+/Ca2+ exchanger [Aspergillus saccharolyticus JOP 1030-1]PYH41872.1 vacuolar H+/Ca2+ exchanger [Aspergillus saccharolyticus JOP 1030-1]